MRLRRSTAELPDAAAISAAAARGTGAVAAGDADPGAHRGQAGDGGPADPAGAPSDQDRPSGHGPVLMPAIADSFTLRAAGWARAVSVPSIVASARKTAAISGGTGSPCSETMRNRSVNMVTSG
jgi:hypothetical protein